MLSDVIQFPTRRPPRRASRPRPETIQRRLLEKLAKQATAIREGRLAWNRAPELDDLRYFLQASSPRAKSIKVFGIRFEIWHGLLARYAVCPETKRPLVGVVDL